MSPKPTLRWGVIATGQVSSWFVRDLALHRPDAKANHVIQAIGSSSAQKGKAFVEKFIPGVSPAPRVCGSYAEVFADPNVDIVYIGTPHAFHKQNCLDAIAAGKHVMCEKAFALTASDAKEVFDAAEKKGGVFVMEALRMRFFPLVLKLLDLVYREKAIGDVHRVFCDLGLDMDIASLGPESRLRNPALGAGTLLDICIYSLTWGLLLLDPRNVSKLSVLATQTLFEDVDTATSVLLTNPTTGAHGILTSTASAKTPSTFCRIEGTEGHITVDGESASMPQAFTLIKKPCAAESSDGNIEVGQESKFTLEPPGWGLYWEADAAALDIAEGRIQNATMPWTETRRVMELMDEIRRQGGAKLPQDEGR